MIFCFVSEFFFRTTRELEYLFFSEFHIRLYDKNSKSDYFFFPPPKSEYFFQQHWESEIFFPVSDLRKLALSTTLHPTGLSLGQKITLCTNSRQLSKKKLQCIYFCVLSKLGHS